MKRNIIFSENEIYHICNKSIANFGIFKDSFNAKRLIFLLDYYNTQTHPKRFSHALRDKSYKYQNLLLLKNTPLVKFISYCIMPDHYHILVKILKEGSLSKYINDVEIGFSRFFNLKFDRKGPLWQSRFRAVRIKTDEQLLHVTRYIHLNPTTAGLVENPDDWEFSSYRDYITNKYFLKEILTEITNSDLKKYKQFVEDRIEYQKKLKKIKKLLLE